MFLPTPWLWYLRPGLCILAYEGARLVSVYKYSMYNFARWWNKRSATNVGYSYSRKNKMLLSTGDIVKDFYIKITYKNNYSIVKSNQTIDLKDIIWEKNKTVSFSQDLSRIRKFYWRDILHNYESKKARKQF